MERAAMMMMGLVGVGCGGAAREASPPPAPLRALAVEIEEVEFGEVERTAAQREVAENVATRAAGDHIDLPEAVVSGAPDPDAWPQVTVMNDTAHGMVVWMSGPCARTIALPPHSQMSAEVCEGTYQVAGQVTQGHFLPLVGEPDPLDNGYQYTFTFYVQRNPYGTRRRRRRRRMRP